MNDLVNHPDHYGGASNTYETIKKIAAKGIDYLRGFCLGNAEKYIDRAGKKGSESELRDLQKSRWYLDYFIRYLEHGMVIVPKGSTKGAPGRSRVWYSTKEKLPAEDEEVLGYYPTDNDRTSASTLIMKKRADGWVSMGGGVREPTYWIRLPDD